METESIFIDPPVIAHRGASCYAPENTMSAFVRAAQLGIHWVEFDVMLAACGTAIIFHDETLDRTTNGSGYVDQYPYSYLQTLDAGRWFNSVFSGERIPTLEQVAEFLKESGMKANVEIKPLPGQEEATVDETLRVLSPYMRQSEQSFLFSSFSMPSLRYLRAQNAACLIGMLMHEWIPEWKTIADELNCVSVNVNQEILTPDLVDEIKKLNKILLSYTVNEVSRAEQLYSWGVDAVFSDCPDRIARFV